MTSSEPPEAHHVDVRVVSRDPEQLAAFIQLCRTIEDLGRVGASRTIPVHVDGDGAADLRFDFGDTDVSDVVPLDSDGDEIEPIGIGV